MTKINATEDLVQATSRRLQYWKDNVMVENLEVREFMPGGSSSRVGEMNISTIDGKPYSISIDPFNI